MQKEELKFPVTNNFKFFRHKDCEFFPCHNGIAEEEFNCLFCYCPLYFLGEECGGNFKYSKNGKKDCSDCRLPHMASNYDEVVGRLQKAISTIADNTGKGLIK